MKTPRQQAGEDEEEAPKKGGKGMLLGIVGALLSWAAAAFLRPIPACLPIGGGAPEEEEKESPTPQPQWRLRCQTWNLCLWIT